MERRGRVFMYPPIYDEIDEWGDQVYRVVFRHGQGEIIGFGGELSWEEAHEQVREILRSGLRDGRYQESDFYPQDPSDMYMQQSPYFIAPDGPGMEEEQGNAGHRHGCVHGIPASGEAIFCLPETSVKEGECSVCLMDFRAWQQAQGDALLPLLP